MFGVWALDLLTLEMNEANTSQWMKILAPLYICEWVSVCHTSNRASFEQQQKKYKKERNCGKQLDPFETCSNLFSGFSTCFNMHSSTYYWCSKPLPHWCSKPSRIDVVNPPAIVSWWERSWIPPCLRGVGRGGIFWDWVGGELFLNFCLPRDEERKVRIVLDFRDPIAMQAW